MPTTSEIPLSSADPSFKIRTTLEGVNLILRFDWNDRLERWVISFFDEVENPLVYRVPLQVDHELIYRFEINGLPPGFMILYDTSDKRMPCGRNDLGKRCRLLYQTLN